MRLDQDNTEGIIIFSFIIALTSIIVGGIAWDNQQQRILFQNIYNKSMECRSAYSQANGNDLVNQVCGEIPTWEGFNYAKQ